MPTAPGRISKPVLTSNGKLAKNNDVQARLDRLEGLLEKVIVGPATNPTLSLRPSAEIERREPEAQPTSSSNSQTSQGGGIASDDGDGTLLLDGGQSQFVSSLHYALLADEVRLDPPNLSPLRTYNFT